MNENSCVRTTQKSPNTKSCVTISTYSATNVIPNPKDKPVSLFLYKKTKVSVFQRNKQNPSRFNMITSEHRSLLLFKDQNFNSHRIEISANFWNFQANVRSGDCQREFKANRIPLPPQKKVVSFLQENFVSDTTHFQICLVCVVFVLLSLSFSNLKSQISSSLISSQLDKSKTL